MKTVISTLAIVSLAGISSLALANQVTLRNKTPQHPMVVNYQVAHKNQAGPTLLGPHTIIHLNRQQVISITSDGYQKSGIVVNAVNGHVLPKRVTRFDMPHTCSVATDQVYPSRQLSLGITISRYPGKSTLTCSRNIS